jgi:hypothetical protein
MRERGEGSKSLTCLPGPEWTIAIPLADLPLIVPLALIYLA